MGGLTVLGLLAVGSLAAQLPLAGLGKIAIGWAIDIGIELVEGILHGKATDGDGKLLKWAFKFALFTGIGMVAGAGAKATALTEGARAAFDATGWVIKGLKIAVTFVEDVLTAARRGFARAVALDLCRRASTGGATCP